jgi:hypothetical protein
MLIEKLDRTQWRLSKAIEHVTTEIQHAIARGEMPAEPDPALPRWRQAGNPHGGAANQAAREVQVALRDGELHAQGRLSTTPSRPWTHGLERDRLTLKRIRRVGGSCCTRRARTR